MKTGPRNIGLCSLMQYKFPITAISSILHRISGFLLFLLIPYLLYVFQMSLVSEQSFSQLTVNTPICKGMVWLFLSALWYHILAGIKHFFMDVGFFESLCGGKAISTLVLLLGIGGAAWIGVWLW